MHDPSMQLLRVARVGQVIRMLRMYRLLRIIRLPRALEKVEGMIDHSFLQVIIKRPRMSTVGLCTCSDLCKVNCLL